MAINAQVLQGQWNQLKGQVREKWGQLTDEDLQIGGGNIDQLVGKIQQRTGEGREAVEKFLTDLSSKGGSTVAKATEAAGQFAQVAGDRLKDQYGQLKDKYGNLADEARDRYEGAQDLVRQNPGPSVAAALGVGIVVGLVLGVTLKSR